MKILFFIEDYYCGGIDTFFINLLNSWPNVNDRFVLIANDSYPGLSVIKKNLTANCQIITHSNLTYSSSLNKNIFFKILKKLLSPIYRYALLSINIFSLRDLIKSTQSDALMVINGGYPGGDSCRAASICWHFLLNKQKSLHNFHNIAQKIPFHSFFQEMLVDYLVGKSSDYFVTVSQAAAESIQVRPIIRKLKNVTYVHNGILESTSYDNFDLNPRSEFNIPESSPLCLMLGTYERRKGHFFLLSAFKRVLVEIPDARLLICGYALPGQMEFVASLVKEFNLAHAVRLSGFRTDSINLLEHSDVLLIASQDFESFGYTAIEAMSRRVPVVTTSVGGLPEVVKNEKGGYCVEKGNVIDYADKVIRLLKYPALRMEQGALGYQRYKDSFSSEEMAKKYYRLIQFTTSSNHRFRQ